VGASMPAPCLPPVSSGPLRVRACASLAVILCRTGRYRYLLHGPISFLISRVPVLYVLARALKRRVA